MEAGIKGKGRDALALKQGPAEGNNCWRGSRAVRGVLLFPASVSAVFLMLLIAVLTRSRQTMRLMTMFRFFFG